MSRADFAAGFERVVGGAELADGGVYACFACRVLFRSYLNAVRGCRSLYCPRCGASGEYAPSPFNP